MTDAAKPTIDALLAHRPWVRSLARSLVADPAGADDLEQQVWLATLRSPPRNVESPRAWLATVARNAARRLHRGDTRRQRREAAAAREDGSGDSPHDLVARAEMHRGVVDAVIALPEPLRQAVLLRYFEDVPVAGVAERTGVPLETARSRLRLAGQRLRERLAPDDRSAHALAVFAFGSVPQLATGATGAAAHAAASSSSTTTLGVTAMASTTKIALATLAVVTVVAAGLGLAWSGARSDSDRLRDQVASLNEAAESAQAQVREGDAELRALERSLADLKRRAASESGEAGADAGAPEPMDADAPAADRAARASGAGSGGADAAGHGAPGASGAGSAADASGARDPADATAADLAWQESVTRALAEKPDSERHMWALRELVTGSLDTSPSNATRCDWAVSMLERVARKGGVGPREAERLERDYRAAPVGAPAAPYLAAAAAVGWVRDSRQGRFLESIPSGERPDVHAVLLRTLDHFPSEGFTDYYLRLVRDETEDGLLRSVFDEDRAAAAAALPSRSRDVVLALSVRLAGSGLSDGLRRKGLFALGVASLKEPAEGAAELRRLAASMDADSSAHKNLLEAADLIEAGTASERDLKRLLD